MGISLVELMVGLGLTSGLVLMDLQRQKNAQIVGKSQAATEAISGLNTDIRSWLRQTSTIDASFGVDAGDNRKKIAHRTTNPLTPPPTSSDREKAAPTDEFAVKGIALKGGNPVIEEGMVGGVPLMGPRQDGGEGGIRSLDQAGWVYIKTMWVQDFSEYAIIDVDTDNDEADIPPPPTPTPRTTLSRGTANLKVLIWKYNNLIDNPGYDCISNYNCEREVLTLPLDLRIVKVRNFEGPLIHNVDQIYDGTFGIQCHGLNDNDSINNSMKNPVGIDTQTWCNPNEIFEVVKRFTVEDYYDLPNTPNAPDPWPSTLDANSIGYMNAHCCRFVQ